MDNLKMHKGKLVKAWLEAHPRFVCHFTPVHCSWMNQVEQWFSILQRKRLSISDFSSLTQLADRLMAFVDEWNTQAHPFNWSTKSIAKLMPHCQDHDVDEAGRHACSQRATRQKCGSLADLTVQRPGHQYTHRANDRWLPTSMVPSSVTERTVEEALP